MMFNPVHLIAAVGLSGQLSFRGRIPWHQDPALVEHVQRDLRQFAKMTAAGVLIIGRATLETMLMSFRPKDRVIVCWTRSIGMSPADLIQDVRRTHPDRNIWICGGQKVYELFIPFVDCHHISVIPYDGPADRWMPPILPTWMTRNDARREFVPSELPGPQKRTT